MDPRRRQTLPSSALQRIGNRSRPGRVRGRQAARCSAQTNPNPGYAYGGRRAIIRSLSAQQAIRPPKQQRSRESYGRVLDAAYALLEENGFEGFTIQEVAARAAVSVGAIYERFGNKETLLRAVHARLMEDLARQAGPGAGNDSGPDGQSSAPAADVIEAWVRNVALTMNCHRAVLRAFMHIGALDEVISQRGSCESADLCRSFKSALIPYVTEFSHPEPEVALDVAFRLTYSTLARQVMYGAVFESDVEIEWDRLTSELAGACAAYLLR
jgi:AcrR family transcriptional regulator